MAFSRISAYVGPAFRSEKDIKNKQYNKNFKQRYAKTKECGEEKQRVTYRQKNINKCKTEVETKKKLYG